MPDSEFFRKLGLFVIRDFFDRDTCERLRTASRAAEATLATVYDGTETRKIEADVRRTSRAKVPPEVKADVTSRLMAIKPDVERHFKVALTSCQDPQFLIYREGDFFSRHSDGGDDPDEPEGIRIRKISVVIFLTDESAAAGECAHAGGSLVFYDLLGDPRLARQGMPLAGQLGLLVAFPAHTPHRVALVTAGERHSIVSWFV